VKPINPAKTDSRRSTTIRQEVHADAGAIELPTQLGNRLTERLFHTVQWSRQVAEVPKSHQAGQPTIGRPCNHQSDADGQGYLGTHLLPLPWSLTYFALTCRALNCNGYAESNKREHQRLRRRDLPSGLSTRMSRHAATLVRGQRQARNIAVGR